MNMLASHLFGESGEFEDLSRAVKWSARTIAGGRWEVSCADVIEEQLFQKTPHLWSDAETEIVYELGRAMFFELYSNMVWSGSIRAITQKKAFYCMVCYENWTKIVEQTCIAFLCCCKYQKLLHRDVARLVAAEVWKSRSKPGEHGWSDIVKYESLETFGLEE
jgi:hypothetical protein